MWHVLKQIARTGFPGAATPTIDIAEPSEAGRIQDDILRLLGRALCIRQIDAGSCNACELEIQALNNPYYNIEGLGIKFVASPRHADMLLITGPVTKNMTQALKLAYEATPDPKLVVALGDCAANGGVFQGSYACCGALAQVLPVDVTVPGCPPPPLAILSGILAAVRLRVTCAP